MKDKGQCSNCISAFGFTLKILFVNVLPSIMDLSTDILNGLTMTGALKDFYSNWCSDETDIWEFFSDLCEKTDEGDSIAMPRKVAGSISLSMVFWPGIVMAIKMLVIHIKGKDYRKIPYILCYVPFPLYIIFVEVKTIFHPNTRSYRKQLIQILSMEAFYESFPQLVLQTLTIIYGYPVNLIQLLSILFSFLVLTKTILMIDNQDEVTSELGDQKSSERENDGFVTSVKNAIMYNFWLFPLYISSAIYKVSVFSLTIAFFRVWSLLTMSLLILQLIILAKIIGFKDVDSWLYPVFNNFFLINIGGANMPDTVEEVNNGKGTIKELIKETLNDKDVDAFEDANMEMKLKDRMQKSYKFAKRSLVLSFVHHTLVLSAIAALVVWYGQSNTWLFQKDEQTNTNSSENFFYSELVSTQEHWQQMRAELYPYKNLGDERCDFRPLKNLTIEIENFHTVNSKIKGINQETNSRIRFDLDINFGDIDEIEENLNNTLPQYNKLVKNCKILEHQIKLYDFFLIIGGVTLVGFFNLLLSIYSARDVKIKQHLDHTSINAKSDKRIQTTEEDLNTTKEAKMKAFENAFGLDDISVTKQKRNSVGSMPYDLTVSKDSITIDIAE